MRIRPAVVAPAFVSAVLLLTGCSTSDGPASTDASPPAPELLAAHDLDGLTAEQIVERLDRTADKPQDLIASVRYDELLVSDPADPEPETALPVEDEFYLSVAPYVETTHDCYFHSLTTCKGELAGEELDVTITSADGDVLVDETVTAYPNGFVGFWLPRDVEATLEVAYDGRNATTDIATGPEDPTCLTTLRLT